MRQMFYSELLDKTFDTEAECLAAEEEKNKELEAVAVKKAERAEDAKHVEELCQAAIKANEDAKAALNEFCKKHGAFHTSIKNTDNVNNIFNDLFYNFFRF